MLFTRQILSRPAEPAMPIAISERFRNSALAAQLRNSRSRRVMARRSAANGRLPLRTAIVWWVGLALVGWGLIAASLQVFKLLG